MFNKTSIKPYGLLVKLLKKDKAMKDCKLMFASAVCLMCLQVTGYATVALPRVLSSHMVLQRDVNVPIWGTAAPSEMVTVRFRGQEKSTTADAQGKWKVSLDPLQVGWPTPLEIGVPADLTVTGSNTLRLTNVLVGEVWLGSGQSNMFGSASQYVIKDTVLKDMVAISYPKIRLIRLETGSAVWTEANPANLQAFSALLFSFGHSLRQDLNVPVGLLVGAVAGESSGKFLSQEAFNSDLACKYLVNSDKTGKTGTTYSGVIGQRYETIIRPCIPYAIRGVLWDQGESSTGLVGIDQYTVMGALIKGWRKDWGQDFPFIYVQKPSGGGCAWDNTDPVTSKGESLLPQPMENPSSKGGFKDYLRIRSYPNTFMSTSSDLSPTTDPTSEQKANGITYNEAGMHPENKSGFGARAARVALGGVYNTGVEIYGPVYKSYRIEGNQVIISFDHVGRGLAFKTDSLVNNLQGFMISGDVEYHNFNRPVFVWADAVIRGDTVVVSSPSVPKPVAVRYAWHDNRRWANLFNQDGLPALPFSTYPPYQNWAAARGLNNATKGREEGDSDGDGLKNIQEWAFGTNPTAGPGSTIQMSAGELIARGAPTTFTRPDGQGGVNLYALFGRRKDAASVGLTYAVEFSDTATAWTVSNAIPEVIAQDFEIETVIVPFPLTATNKPTRFFRVRVSGQ